MVTVILIVLIFVAPVLGGICFGLGVNHRRETYIVTENPNCYPPGPFKIVEVFNSLEKAFDCVGQSRTRWVQIWMEE